MNVKIQKSQLINALSIVRKALSSHNVNPIYDGIYLQAAQDKLKLICSDSTIQIENSADAIVQEEGSIVVPGHLFAEISSKLPDASEIEIAQSSDQGSATIKSASFNMNLQAMSADDFPKMPTIASSQNLTISEATLKDMITRTWFSAAQDQTRPILTGLLFEVEEENKEQLTVVALSNNRMAMAKEKCQSAESLKAVIPATTLNKVSGILSDDEEKQLILKFGKSHVFFDIGDTKIHCSLLAGEFMRYKSLIPDQFKTNIFILRKELSDAVNRASLMARDNDKKFIRFCVENDSLLISSNSEMGYVRESLPISCNGSELEIAFNVKYISDILSKLDDEEIVIRFQGSNVAAVFEPMQGKQFLYLVAPVQI